MLAFQSPPATPFSLLVVEDDPTARQLTLSALRMKFPSLNLLQASNGEEGMDLYEKQRPDIVITDIKMPIRDGISMAQSILNISSNANIIVISGHTEIRYLLKSISLGVKHYVLKPLNYDALFNAVCDCVRRLQLERQVREQEQYLHLAWQVVEQSSSLIAVADRQGKIVYANRKYLEFTGYDGEEILRRDLRQLHFVDSPDADFDYLWNTIASGEEWRGEGVNRKHNGEHYHEAASIAPITDQGGDITHFVTIREDISSRKRTQEELDRAQKLESLGGLAGGIAHDFNNTLTGVLGNISLALTRIPESDPLKKSLQAAEKAALRSAELTRQLLTFSRGGTPMKKAVSLRRLVEEAVASALQGGNVVGEISIADSIDAIEADGGQMLQAFGNLLQNAVQAMPGGGKVMIEADKVALPAGNEFGLEPGSYVRIAFSDEGCGIPEGIRANIFDPYFSTKSGHKGLGLASVHSIVAKHRGHVGLDSAPGRGSTFVCHIPVTGEPQPVRSRALPLPTPNRLAERQAVLIMDDDFSVSSTAKKIIHCLGYDTTICSNGVDAISLYSTAKNDGKPYLAVLMDLTIVGGMGGKEAAQHILALDADARLVVSSGYSDDEVLANPHHYGFCAVLPKPYRVANVAEVLNSLQGSPPA